MNLKNHQIFLYLRDKYHIQGDTLILCIPGESHGTSGDDYHSKLQEQKTVQLISQVQAELTAVKNIIIYNHTQGDYDRSTGRFQSASLSLNNFLNNLPSNIQNKVFVQSHNHWSYTQFSLNEGVHYIMNNAGLHEGVHNMVEIDNNGVSCYDIDPNIESVTELKLNTNFNNYSNDSQLIERNYPDANIILARKNQPEEINVNPIQETDQISESTESEIIETEQKQYSNEELNNLKKRIFQNV